MNLKTKGFRCYDKGHYYMVNTIDGHWQEAERIRFVKRIGKNFPGNTGEPYSGTTLQLVLRVLIDRVGYLQRQKWCVENVLITLMLSCAVWLLEFRAARRHGKIYFHGLKFAVNSWVCEVCGHTECEHRIK